MSPNACVPAVQLLIYSTRTGPAVHLVNLLPPAASLATPSVPLAHGILCRAELPLDAVALAVCVLDSLDSKFARHWRLSCPLATLDFSSASAKRHTLPANPIVVNQLHIDSVRPEVIIVAALMIALKFTADQDQPTQYFAWAWGRSMWSCEQLNFTERCIMENLNYRILPLMDQGILGDALSDMDRAGKYAIRQQQRQQSQGSCRDALPHLRSMSTGVAVTGLGLQLTPVDSPGPGNVYSVATLGDETQAAFQRPSTLTQESLHLPGDGKIRY